MKQRKKYLVLSMASLLAFGLFSCGNQSESSSKSEVFSSQSSVEPETVIEKITISNKASLKADMYVNEKQTLNVSLTAKKGSNSVEMTLANALKDKYVTLLNYDKKVITISDAGEVTAVGVGTTTAGFASAKNAEIKDSIEFTVFDQTVTVDSVSITNATVFSPNVSKDAQKELQLSITAHKGRADAVTVTGAEALSQGLISIESSDAEILKIEGLVAKSVAPGTATITIKDQEGKALATQSVKVANRLDGQVTLNLLTNADDEEVREDKKGTLPTFEAFDKDGSDLSSSVTVTDSLGETVEASATEFSSHTFGTHVLTYTVTNANGDTATKTVNRTVYRRILGDGGDKDNITTADEATSPVVSSTNTGVGLRNIYMPNGPSKKYYVEWEFSATTNYADYGTDNFVLVAGAHYSSADCDPTKGGFIYNGYKVAQSGSYELADSTVVKAWDAPKWNARIWSSTDLLKGNDINVNPTSQSYKIAVARNGAAFYTFINDKLAHVQYNAELAASDSTPGFMLLGTDSVAPNTTLSNFGARLEGDEAVTKIDSLTGNMFEYYQLYEDSAGTNKATFDANSNSFSYKDEMVSYDNYNNTMVFAPAYGTTSDDYMYGWKVSYTTAVTGVENDGWGKLTFEIRTIWDKLCIFKVSQVCSKTGPIYECKTNEWNDSGVGNGRVDFMSDLKSGFGGEAPSMVNLKQEISCFRTGATQETYFIKWTQGEKSYEKKYVVDYTSNASTIAGGKYLVFHSAKWAGKISDYKMEVVEAPESLFD